MRNADLCNVRIKVSRPVDGTAVTVERLDEYTHTHDIEESFRIKKPSILVGCIKSEVAKNYSASQIYHAVRGAGKHEGSERLKELGGSSLKTKDVRNLKRGLGSADLRARIAKGKELSRFDENLQCHCKFHRQYLLPCRHIFHLDTEIKVLTTVQWKAYLMMFEECGMEVYETMGAVWVETDEDSGRNAERANTIGRVRESFKQVQQQLYTAYELMDQLNLDDNTVQSQRMEEWANHVQVTLASLTSVRAEDIVNRHRPWEL
ncbi:hypothetical protein BGX38DRAFT_649404 [Terfezia claveryi]|nr:hypothetical protein BGX38DRAFT_649404 [Terfezia claveryi]